MLTASSIRYGGMLVDAAECDYTSFKHLGLLCPICKRSVFLVGKKLRPATTRKNKDGRVSDVKESNVCSYFAHHSDVDRDTINDCELRSSQITQAHRLAAETISRNQRQKIMQAHLWKITRSSLLLHELELYEKIFPSMWMSECIYTDKRKLFALNELIKFAINHLLALRGEPLDICINKTVKEVLKQSESITKSILNDKFVRLNGETSKVLSNDSIYKDFTKRVLSHSIKLCNSIDLQMHSQIISEVLLFLAQKRQHPMLEKLVLISMHLATNRLAISMVGEIETVSAEKYAKNYRGLVKGLIGCGELDLIDFSHSVIENLIMVLAEVNWAEQFEALESKELVYSYQGKGFGK